MHLLMSFFSWGDNVACWWVVAAVVFIMWFDNSRIVVVSNRMRLVELVDNHVDCLPDCIVGFEESNMIGPVPGECTVVSTRLYPI